MLISRCATRATLGDDPPRRATQWMGWLIALIVQDSTGSKGKPRQNCRRPSPAQTPTCKHNPSAPQTQISWNARSSNYKKPHAAKPHKLLTLDPPKATLIHIPELPRHVPGDRPLQAESPAHYLKLFLQHLCRSRVQVQSLGIICCSLHFWPRMLRGRNRFYTVKDLADLAMARQMQRRLCSSNFYSCCSSCH